MAECSCEYAEHYPDAYGEPGNPESSAGSGVRWRTTGIPALGSHYPQTGTAGEGRNRTLYRTDVFHGTDGIFVIQ